MADLNYDYLAHPTVVNPMAAYRDAAQTANLFNENRLFRAREAAGQNFLNSINPDGTTNQNALLQGLKNTPDAALAAQPSAQAGQTLSADEYGQQVKRLAYGGAGAMQILADNNGAAPLPSLKAYYDRAVQDGHLTAADEAAVMAGFTDDPTQNAAIVRQRLMQNINAQEAMSRGQPQPAQQNLGGQIRTIDTNPNTNPSGPGAVGTSVAPTTGPETNAALHETYVENPKQPGTYLRVMVPRSALPGASGVADGAPSPLGTGRVTPPPGSPLLKPGASDPTSTAMPLAAPPQGQPELLATDQKAFKTDQLAVPQGQQNVQSLQKAQIALEASNTGRSSEGVHNMLAAMQTLGIPTLGLADDVASYDLAHKYLMDYARKSGAAARSDLQLQTSEGANASTGINQQAALDVVHTNIGRERQAIAQNMEADQGGVGYGSHVARFSTSTDPRGFAIDAYKPADLDPSNPKSMVGKMTDTERAKFYKSVGIAKRLGLLNSGAAP